MNPKKRINPPLPHRITAGGVSLQTCFEVFSGKQPSGKVQVLRQGLYYQFHCRCRLSGSGMYRLFVRCGSREENLGIVVPMDGGFGLDTRIPVKRLGEGEMEFKLVPKHHEHPGERFAPIYPEEPFSYLSGLKDAYLARQGDQLGIMIGSRKDGPD